MHVCTTFQQCAACSVHDADYSQQIQYSRQQNMSDVLCAVAQWMRAAHFLHQKRAVRAVNVCSSKNVQ